MTLKTYLLIAVPTFLMVVLFLFAREQCYVLLLLVGSVVVFVAFLCIVVGMLRFITQTLAGWWKTA